MTHQELFSGTRAALEQVEFLRWIPCSIDADYRYGVCFAREEGRGAQELNTILPGLLKARGISFSSVESAMTVSGGTAFVPGLDHRVGISFNEFEVSATLWGPGGLVRDDPTLPAWGNFAMKRLGDASKDIAARLLGSKAALEGQVDCIPSSNDAYCVTTAFNSPKLFSAVIKQFYGGGEPEVLPQFQSGRFKVLDYGPLTKELLLNLTYQREPTRERYTVWSWEYDRKTFTITLESATGQTSVLRVAARWVDGYTPPPEEK